jgi:hypothetical protein
MPLIASSRARRRASRAGAGLLCPEAHSVDEQRDHSLTVRLVARDARDARSHRGARHHPSRMQYPRKLQPRRPLQLTRWNRMNLSSCRRSGQAFATLNSSRAVNFGLCSPAGRARAESTLSTTSLSSSARRATSSVEDPAEPSSSLGPSLLLFRHTTIRRLALHRAPFRPAAEKLVDLIVRAIARQALEQAEMAARAAKSNKRSQKSRVKRTAPSGKRITSRNLQSP